MEFVYILRPARTGMVTEGPTPAERAAVAEHFAHLKALTQQGIVRLAGRTARNDPETFGIVVFDADSEEEARMRMESDPAVRQGIMTARLYPFQVALARATP